MLRVRFMLTAGVLFGLVACSSSRVISPRYDIRAAADVVPMVVSQAVSLSHRLNWGLQAQDVGELNFYTLRTVDLDGEPFIDITISSPVVANGFWDLTFFVSGDEWDPEDFESPWTTSLTGASTARDVFVVGNVGLSLPMRMAATVTALGGLENVLEVVAIEQQTFVIRDVQNRLWDTYAQQPLSEEQTAYVHSLYADMVGVNSDPAVAERLQEEWEEVLASEEIDEAGGLILQATSRIDLAGFTRLDGSLDVRKVQDYLLMGSNGLASQVVEPEQRPCFLFICQLIRTGYIPASKQALQDGGAQSPAQFGWPQSHHFAMPYCVTTDTVNTDAVLGCGPAAFIGLVQRKFVGGDDFFDTHYNGAPHTTTAEYLAESKVKELAQRMTAPLGLHGRPLIANYMGTCWNTGGSMTIGAGFRDGMIAFLAAHAKKHYTITSNFSHYTGNVTSAPVKAGILVRNIGQKENPVIAEYFRGVGQGHYSPVKRYAIYDTGANGLNVQTLTDPLEWMSLSGTWGTERGVFALE